MNDNKNALISDKYTFLLSNVILIAIGIVLYFCFVFRKRNIEKEQSKNKDKLQNRKIIFQQKEENAPAKYILTHIPGEEIFISTLHPAASLYEDVTDHIKVKECFNTLKKILNENKIELITVRDALKLNKIALKKLAFKSLKYEITENINFDKASKEYEIFLKYTSDEYKQGVIDKLSEDQLIDVILNNPKYILQPTKLNTFIEPKIISFNPLGALVFCRDQQITTKKGVVIGRARSSQRDGEHIIMKQVF